MPVPIKDANDATREIAAVSHDGEDIQQVILSDSAGAPISPATAQGQSEGEVRPTAGCWTLGRRRRIPAFPGVVALPAARSAAE